MDTSPVTNTDNVSLQVDKGQYEYRPVRRINVTEYKWQFEDIKPLINDANPLKFKVDDRPYPFCPREVELHLYVRFWETKGTKLATVGASGIRVVPVNNFGYSCIRQINCRVNNAETEAASGINLAYREYFRQLLEADPWQERSTLKRQGWYRDDAGYMESFGGSTVKDLNKGGLAREMALIGQAVTRGGSVAHTSQYEFSVNPIPCNFCQIEQNMPPNTKVELDIFFNRDEFCLVAKDYKAEGDGGVVSDNKAGFTIDVAKSFLRLFYRVPQQQVMTQMEQQVQATTVMNPMLFPIRRMRCDNYLIQVNNVTPELNNVFRGRSPRLFWLVIVPDKTYQGDFHMNPFNFTNHHTFHPPTGQTANFKVQELYCTANGVPVPRVNVDLTKPLEVFDLLLNASGKTKRDGYLLDPDTFQNGYFIVPFDLTAAQDGGESSSPLIPMLVNVRLKFEFVHSVTQVLFFYNIDETLLQLDNRGTIKGPVPLGDV